MWSLGRMLKSIPELVLDPSRYIPLFNNLSNKLTISPELTSRACWLLNTCFNCYIADDEESYISKEFTKFSDLLLGAISAYSDPNTDDAAFGALNRLIEKTPATLVSEYNTLFQKVINQVGILLQSSVTTIAHHQMIGFCSIIQALIINVSEQILPFADELMNLLNSVLGWSDLVGDVLPAMGAIARAIGPQFEKYASASLELIFNLLSRSEYIHPAAIFVGDICSTGIAFPDEVTNNFVGALFVALERDDIPLQTRNAVFSALGEIVKQVKEKSDSWLEKLLFAL